MMEWIQFKSFVRWVIEHPIRFVQTILAIVFIGFPIALKGIFKRKGGD